MTQAKAQACASAIIGAGFDATIHRNTADGTSWTVRAQSDGYVIDSSQIASLVASQGVTGRVSVVEFS